MTRAAPSPGRSLSVAGRLAAWLSRLAFAVALVAGLLSMAGAAWIEIEAEAESEGDVDFEESEDGESTEEVRLQVRATRRAPRGTRTGDPPARELAPPEVPRSLGPRVIAPPRATHSRLRKPPPPDDDDDDGRR